MVWRTTIITCTTCFLLGTTFTHWIADHNVLWSSPLTPGALEQSIRYYALIAGGSAALGWVYIGVLLVAFVAAAGKLCSDWGKGGEILFDGASVFLLSSIMYNQATEVYPTFKSFPVPLPAKLTEHEIFPGLAGAVRDLANDNIITAVMLTGIMFLQAGRYYSSRSSGDHYPRSGNTSAATSAAATPRASPKLDNVRLSPVSERNATPYRELTEEESFELRSLESDESGAEAKANANAVKAGKAKPRRR